MRILFILLVVFSLYSDDVSIDVAGAQTFNHSLNQLRLELREKFDQVTALSKNEAKEGEYRALLADVRDLRQKILRHEEKWRNAAVEEALHTDDAYALWDIGEVTLAQLVMECGASDYLYVIPQELSGMKISLFSSIPLPHESWSEMIEMILAQNGVGAKKLNPFVKQLYILKLDPSAIEGIVSKETDLQLFASHARLFYVFSPPAEQLKSVQTFFERFSDPKQTMIQAIGSKVALVAARETIEKLIGLYHAVWEQSQGKVARLVRISKINAQEAEKILKAVFSDAGSKNRPSYYPSNADELVTLVLPQGLVLIGENETVERGEKIIADMESQLDDPGEKLIFWYTCKHSNPEDIAGVLEKVYDSLMGTSMEKKAEANAQPPSPVAPAVATPETPPSTNGVLQPPPNMYNPVMPATAPFIQPGTVDKNQKKDFGNFIVDTKTTSILMVVRREELPKIKALLKKMDVPKRMVQLDVLLVEKKLHDRRKLGFNLLQIGANASKKHEDSITFDARDLSKEKGILSYMFSRKSSHRFPAVDIKFDFLLAQEDIRINANPSVLALNQTQALISNVEELSINNGAITLQTSAGPTVEKSFTRAQYGTTILLTPTIHMPDEEDGPGFVSLQTKLEFDTTQRHSIDDRPPVTRRHVENEVRVADGETIILGGLRSKIEEDTREKIPFLGDLPGLGKLFGSTAMHETNSEMFIFITPHIIKDPVDDLRRIRQYEYSLRAGDIPEFLSCIDQAKQKDRNQLFKHSLKLLFDMY